MREARGKRGARSFQYRVLRASRSDRSLVRRLCAHWIFIEERGRPQKNPRTRLMSFPATFSRTKSTTTARLRDSDVFLEGNQDTVEIAKLVLASRAGAQNAFPCSACLLHCVALKASEIERRGRRVFQKKEKKKKKAI